VLETSRADGLTLLRLCIPGADGLSPLEFQRVATCGYRLIRERLTASGAHPIRFWNVIPRIRTSCGDGLDRYMVFNAGRFAAYTEWYGTAEGFDGAIATATGVGHEGDDLHIAAFGAVAPGVPVENPRQRRAYQYSARYGPMPPCFSRGTVCPVRGNLPSFIIGGTSSVRGEESVHVGNVLAQTGETLRNIGALLVAALARQGRRPLSEESVLKCIDTLRVYLVKEQDADLVLPMVTSLLRGLDAPAEIVRADICRPDLLVEIEGTADFQRLNGT
jgi:chorismate lyase/3-hydroxybenzoate synthase